MPSNISEPTLSQRRMQIARANRVGDPVAAADARRDYYAAKLADYVQQVVATAPPLTADQRARIASLLAHAGGEEQ